MVAYSFRPRFIEPIRSGTKRQTIRAPRRTHAREGDALQLYTGMRTRSCRLIGRATCISAWPITINMPTYLTGDIEFADQVICDVDELHTFAQQDGFRSWFEMRDFWREEHGRDIEGPWVGVLIRWDFLTVDETT